MFLYLPRITKTGGPESIHNFHLNLIQRDINSFILTDLKHSHETIDYFKDYCPNYIDIKKINEINSTSILLSEVHTHIAPRLLLNSNLTVYIWWLSVKNYIVSRKPRYRLRHIMEFPLFDKNYHNCMTRCIHICQTQFSESFVRRTFGSDVNIITLESPLNQHFYKYARPLELKNTNKIALNPKKLSRKYLRMLHSFLTSNNYDVIILENLTRREIRRALFDCQFFIDIGPHPGQERLPREAILMNCIPIVALNGTSSYHSDVPIPINRKIITDGVSDNFICTQILHQIKEIEANGINDFYQYRAYVEQQPQRFSRQFDQIANILSE